MPGSGMSRGSGVDTRDWQDPKYWRSDAYWAWQDVLYETMRAPQVKVIELKPFVRSVPPKRRVLPLAD